MACFTQQIKRMVLDCQAKHTNIGPYRLTINFGINIKTTCVLAFPSKSIPYTMVIKMANKINFYRLEKSVHIDISLIRFHLPFEKRNFVYIE